MNLFLNTPSDVNTSYTDWPAKTWFGCAPDVIFDAILMHGPPNQSELYLYSSHIVVPKRVSQSNPSFNVICGRLLSFNAGFLHSLMMKEYSLQRLKHFRRPSSYQILPEYSNYRITDIFQDISPMSFCCQSWLLWEKLYICIQIWLAAR